MQKSDLLLEEAQTAGSLILVAFVLEEVWEQHGSCPQIRKAVAWRGVYVFCAGHSGVELSDECVKIVFFEETFLGSWVKREGDLCRVQWEVPGCEAEARDCSSFSFLSGSRSLNYTSFLQLSEGPELFPSHLTSLPLPRTCPHPPPRPPPRPAPPLQPGEACFSLRSQPRAGLSRPSSLREFLPLSFTRIPCVSLTRFVHTCVSMRGHTTHACVLYSDIYSTCVSYNAHNHTYI